MLASRLPLLATSRVFSGDYVTRTVDHTQKYGLGYVLASGAGGALFNDCTSAVARKDAVRHILSGASPYSFEYFEHKVYGTQKIITKEKHESHNPEKRLAKKAILLKYFVTDLFATDTAPGPEKKTAEEGVFVIKHVPFPRGPVFRLSNRTIVFHVDQDVLVFFDEGRALFLQNKASIPRDTLVYVRDVLGMLLKK